MKLHWLDSGKVGTPLFISTLNGTMDMWGPKYWHTNKLIELNTLQYGVIIDTHNLNIVYEFSISLFSKSLIFKLLFKKKLTCLSLYRYECRFFLSFVDNQNMNDAIWFRIFIVRNFQWLLEIRTYTNKNRKRINESSHISLELRC